MSAQGGRTATQPDPRTSGVFTEDRIPACYDVYHCVQRVGFDTAASNPYWRVRNSWRQIRVGLNASDFLMASTACRRLLLPFLLAVLFLSIRVVHTSNDELLESLMAVGYLKRDETSRLLHRFSVHDPAAGLRVACWPKSVSGGTAANDANWLVRPSWAPPPKTLIAHARCSRANGPTSVRTRCSNQAIRRGPSWFQIPRHE